MEMIMLVKMCGCCESSIQTAQGIDTTAALFILATSQPDLIDLQGNFQAGFGADWAQNGLWPNRATRWDAPKALETSPKREDTREKS